MEFAGDEKRVQALFSEQLLEDQRLAPGFESLWTRAERVGPAPVRASRKSLIVIVSVLIIAGAALLAARSWYRSNPSSKNQALNVTPQTTLTPSPEARPQTIHATAINSGVKPRHERQKRLFRPRPLERAAAPEAALISGWQSPTQIFMSSPVAVNFNSLPQLNQSAEQLKQFLSRDTDLKKESNQ
jgi:hypothetical protein